MSDLFSRFVREQHARAAAEKRVRELEASTAAPVSDQQELPCDLRELLHHPDVVVRPDEQECAVKILVPPHLAKSLAGKARDPLQFLLAVRLAEAAGQDALGIKESP